VFRLSLQHGAARPWPKLELEGGDFVTLRPKFGLDLAQKKLIFEVYDSHGQKVIREGKPVPVVVDLERKARTRSLEEVGEWLLKAGAAAIGVALPLLLAAGVFGVVLVVTVGVAKVVGLLLWSLFKLGLLAVAAGVVVKLFQWVTAEVTLEEIEAWFANVVERLEKLARQFLSG
jgi:hypothetical protein